MRPIVDNKVELVFINYSFQSTDVIFPVKKVSADAEGGFVYYRSEPRDKDWTWDKVVWRVAPGHDELNFYCNDRPVDAQSLYAEWKVRMTTFKTSVRAKELKFDYLKMPVDDTRHEFGHYLSFFEQAQLVTDAKWRYEGYGFVYDSWGNVTSMIDTFKLEASLSHISLFRLKATKWDAEHCRVYLHLFAAATGGVCPPVVDIEAPTSLARTHRLFDIIALDWGHARFTFGDVLVHECYREVQDELAKRNIASKSVPFSAFHSKTSRRGVQSTEPRLQQAALEVAGVTGKEVWDIWPLYGDSELHAVLGSTGRGVRVALLDSGIDAAHPDVRRQLRGFRSFVDDEPDAWLDPNGHGTYCGGILAAVAPDCDLFVAKVLRDDRKNGDVASLCAALYWAVDVAECDVISISAGTLAYSAELRAAINHAIECGAIVLCAASNYGRLRMSNIAYPAAFGNTICIGSHDEKGHASRFSSSGREVDFLAPGEPVLAAKAGTGSRAAICGTSMAVPFAAGLAALLVGCVRKLNSSKKEGEDKFELDNELTRMLMRKLCTSFGSHDEDRGFGVLAPMEQLRAHGVAYIENWLVDFLRGDGVSAAGLESDAIKTVCSRLSLNVVSARWTTTNRLQFYIGVALHGGSGRKNKKDPAKADPLTDPDCLVHFMDLCRHVADILAGNDSGHEFRDVKCKCNDLLSRVREIPVKDREMIHHFLVNAKRTDDGNIDTLNWERVVRLLFFGDHGNGDLLGCWVPNDAKFFNQKLYVWPKACVCLHARTQLAKLRGEALQPPARSGETDTGSCPFWTDGSVEFAMSELPLKHMGLSSLLSQYGVVSVNEPTTLHHPLLCEVNPNAKACGLPHACIRPSHLTCGPSVTNELHEMMNKMATKEVGSKPTLSKMIEFAHQASHAWAAEKVETQAAASTSAASTSAAAASTSSSAAAVATAAMTTDVNDVELEQPKKRARKDDNDDNDDDVDDKAIL